MFLASLPTFSSMSSSSTMNKGRSTFLCFSVTKGDSRYLPLASLIKLRPSRNVIIFLLCLFSRYSLRALREVDMVVTGIVIVTVEWAKGVGWGWGLNETAIVTDE